MTKKTNRLVVVACCALFLVFIAACRDVTGASQWRWERAEAGLLRQVIVLAVAADAAQPDRLWAGFYGTDGLAVSQDGGQSWQAGAIGSADNPVFDLLTMPDSVSPTRGKVWAATRDGLFVSSDSGQDWEMAPGSLPHESAFTLATAADGRLYVGLDGSGIYVEAGDGSGWLPLGTPRSSAAPEGPTNGPPGPDMRDEMTTLTPKAVISLAVAPDGQQLYAGTPGQGIFASRDAGRTWNVTYGGGYAPNVALNPRNPTTALASLRDRLVRTYDGGLTWHTVNVPWAKAEIFSLLWLPDGTLGVGTGQGRLYRSLDDGNSWLEGGDGLPPGGGVLDLSVVTTTLTGDAPRLLAGTWTGIFRSDDGGQHWQNVAPALGNPNAQTLLATKAGLMLGARTGLYLWQPDSDQWISVSAGLPSGVSSLAADPQNDKAYFAGTQAHGVFRSSDTAQGWEPVPALIAGIPAVTVDPKDPEHIYILAAWERVYESRDGGQTWDARWDGLGNIIETTALAVDPLKPIAYVGTEAGLYRSENGREWNLALPALVDQTILALHARPDAFNRTVLYVGSTRGLSRSLDNGATIRGSSQRPGGWGRGLENVSVTAILVDPASADCLYAGTAYQGVYESVDGGVTWQSIGVPELQNGVVEAMAWGPDQALFVVTTDGVWQGNRE